MQRPLFSYLFCLMLAACGDGEPRADSAGTAEVAVAAAHRGSIAQIGHTAAAAGVAAPILSARPVPNSDAANTGSVSGTISRASSVRPSGMSAPTLSAPSSTERSITVTNGDRVQAGGSAIGGTTAAAGSSNDGGANMHVNPVTSPGPATAQAPAPIISGTPVLKVTTGSAYRFTPETVDSSGKALTFRIANVPRWATFDVVTGALTGTPGEMDVGAYANIVISVSDGASSASLQPFSLSVIQHADTSLALSWSPPTQNNDGTTLTDLAGYRIYYGTDAAALNQVVEISDPAATSYVVANLGPGTWFFQMQAYTSANVSSDPSTLVDTTIL